MVMDRMLASKVELRATGQIAISTAASQPNFEFVYRAGRDVLWNDAEGCFLTPYSGAVGDSSCSERIGRIAEVLATELGMRLVRKVRFGGSRPTAVIGDRRLSGSRIVTSLRHGVEWGHRGIESAVHSTAWRSGTNG